MSWPVLRCVLEHHGKAIGGVDLLVLIYLADCAHNDDGTGAWPSQRRLAVRTGIHRTTVQRALARLVDEHKAIAIEQRPGRNYRYCVVLCEQCRSAAQRGTRTNQVAAESDRGGSGERQGWQRSAARTSKEPVMNQGGASTRENPKPVPTHVKDELRRILSSIAKAPEKEGGDNDD